MGSQANIDISPEGKIIIDAILRMNTPLSEEAKKLDVKSIIDKAIVALITKKPFYGHIITMLQKVYVSENSADFKTAAVGKRRGERLVKLYINPRFIKSMYDENLSGNRFEFFNRVVGLLEHEVLHILLGHLAIHFHDEARGGVAVDLTINSYIERDRLPLHGQFVEDFGMEPKKSAVWYYENLKNNKRFNSFSKCQLQYIIMLHKFWEEVEKDPIAKELIKDLIRRAKQCNGGYGNTPGDIIEQVDLFLKDEKPKISWAKVLRMFCGNAQTANVTFTQKKISKRFGIRPGNKKEEAVNLAIAVDTSGSVSDEEFLEFFSEIRHIFKNGAEITIIESDCEVCNTFQYDGKRYIKREGFGGTDLEPAVKVAVEGKFDALVYFTDFDAPKIEKVYNIPTLWVVNKFHSRESWPVKFGRVVFMNEEAG